MPIYVCNLHIVSRKLTGGIATSIYICLYMCTPYIYIYVYLVSPKITGVLLLLYICLYMCITYIYIYILS